VRELFFVREIPDITGITLRENEKPYKGIRFEMTVQKWGYHFAVTDEKDIP
jgi:hypothetical protein